MPEVEQLPIEDLERHRREQPHGRDDERDRGADRGHPDATKHAAAISVPSLTAPGTDGRRRGWRLRLAAA